MFMPMSAAVEIESHRGQAANRLQAAVVSDIIVIVIRPSPVVRGLWGVAIQAPAATAARTGRLMALKRNVVAVRPTVDFLQRPTTSRGHWPAARHTP